MSENTGNNLFCNNKNLEVFGNRKGKAGVPISHSSEFYPSAAAILPIRLQDRSWSGSGRRRADANDGRIGGLCRCFNGMEPASQLQDEDENCLFPRLPMDIQKIPVFKMMAAKMQWLEHRQRVLAQNVANADTPGYVPHDLKALDYTKSVQKDSFRLQLATTSEAHRQGSIQKTAFGNEQKSRNNYETSPTGNAVILEEQMIKVADTAAEHQLMTNLYRKQLGMFRIALGRQAGG